VTKVGTVIRPRSAGRVLDEAAVGSQIEVAVAADERRDDQQGPLPDGRGARPVLDELGDVVPIDDVARGDGQVHPDGEGTAVGLRRHPAVVPHVVGELAGSAQEARAGNVERPLEDRRIAGQRVQHAHREPGAFDVVPVLGGFLVLVDEPMHLLGCAFSHIEEPIPVPGAVRGQV
jgi:hypothetical protein